MTASIELLPGIGVAVDGLGTIAFGMTPDEVRELLPPDSIRHPRSCQVLEAIDYGEVRDAHDAWLDGYLEEPGWGFRTSPGDLELCFGGDRPGRDSRLGRIGLHRYPAPPPVIWDGVDVFAEPAADLRALLPVTRVDEPWTDVEPLGLRFHHERSDGRWGTAYLFGPGPNGWSACCDGDLACAKDGDGLVGLIYAPEDRPRP